MRNLLAPLSGLTLTLLGMPSTRAEEPLRMPTVKGLDMAGWVLFQAAEGDLNADGRADWAGVLQPANASELDVDNCPVVIALRQPDGSLSLWKEMKNPKRHVSARRFFMGDDEVTNVDAPPVVSIEKGALRIQLRSGTFYSCAETFRVRGTRLTLVGFDESMFSSGPWGSMTELSCNVLTGRMHYEDIQKKVVEHSDETGSPESDIEVEQTEVDGRLIWAMEQEKADPLSGPRILFGQGDAYPPPSTTAETSRAPWFEVRATYTKHQLVIAVKPYRSDTKDIRVSLLGSHQSKPLRPKTTSERRGGWHLAHFDLRRLRPLAALGMKAANGSHLPLTLEITQGTRTVRSSRTPDSVGWLWMMGTMDVLDF